MPQFPICKIGKLLLSPPHGVLWGWTHEECETLDTVVKEAIQIPVIDVINPVSRFASAFGTACKQPSRKLHWEGNTITEPPSHVSLLGCQHGIASYDYSLHTLHSCRIFPPCHIWLAVSIGRAWCPKWYKYSLVTKSLYNSMYVG